MSGRMGMLASAQLLTRSELKALSWAVRRASNNGGGFSREITAAQRVLEKLSLGVNEDHGPTLGDAANEGHSNLIDLAQGHPYSTA